MTTVNNLPTSAIVSAGDGLPVFIMNEGILMRVSINTLASFLTTELFSGLPKQTDKTVAPVATGLPYVNTDGYVVIAQ